MDGRRALETMAAELVREADERLVVNGPTPTNREAIADAIRRLGREHLPGDAAGLSSLHGSGAASTVLARSLGGLVLMLGRFPSEAPTPIHNHNSWGIVCVVAGRDRYLRWTRLDDGSDPDRARLALAEEVELGVGDVVFLDEPPGDIHSQQGLGRPVWELVLFGHDPDAVPRAYFDPDTGRITYASAAR